jgi:hypothetical protein
MRTSMAYFAGAGTVIAAIGLGLGGGFTIANVMSPHQEKLEQTRLEQRMSAKPIPPSAPADQPKPQLDNVQASNTEANKPQGDQSKGPVPYVAATGAAVTANAPAAQGQPQTPAAAPQASPSPVVEQAKVDNPPARPAEPQTAKPQTAPREQASSSPEDTNAKARSPEDANAKARDADLKRLAAEKRRADRRQQWADRKKAQQQRDAQLRGAEESVRRDTDGPRIVRRDTDGSRIVARQDDGDFDRRGDSNRRGDFDRRGDRGNRPFGFPGFNLFGGDRDD